MRVREYTSADLEALRQMHAQQGFDYAFPNLADPLFVSKLVVEDDAGRAVMASLARLTCEIYLLMDAGKGSRNRHDEGSQNNCGEGNRPSDGEESGKSPCKGPKDIPRERFVRLLVLHYAAEQDLLARGLEDAHAWLPPPIAKRFGRRLESLGWVRDDSWTPYCRFLCPEMSRL